MLTQQKQSLLELAKVKREGKPKGANKTHHYSLLKVINFSKRHSLQKSTYLYLCETYKKQIWKHFAETSILKAEFLLSTLLFTQTL